MIVVDTGSGGTIAWARIEGVVRGLYDVGVGLATAVILRRQGLYDAAFGNGAAATAPAADAP